MEDTIANIVLIDSDDRARREMRQFVKEMDENHQVREFANYQEFAKRYFSASVKSITTHPLASAFTPDQATWVQQQNLATDEPFSPSPLVLEISQKDFQITSMDRAAEGKILGVPADKLLNAKSDVEESVTAPFKADYKRFLKELDVSGQSEVFLAFRGDGGIWLLHLKGKAEGDHFKVEIINMNPEMGDYFATAAKKPQEEQDGSLKILGTIHAIVCKKDDVKTNDYVKWAQELKVQLKRENYYPQNNETRILLTKYDDDGFLKGKLLCQQIEDLISLPPDRPIFKQKLEFALGLPKRVSPSFLFTQPVSERVFISKKSYIDQINDLCISILNPTPLKPGVPTVVYLQLNQGDPLVKLYCKAISSEPHPSLSNFYRVNLAYFGIDKDTFKTIKLFLNDKNYKQLVNPDVEDFKYNPHNLFLTDAEKEKKNIIIIDADIHEANRLKKLVEDDVDNVRVFVEPNYSDFIDKYLSPKKAQKRYSPLGKPGDLYDDQLEFLVNQKTFYLVQCLTSYKTNDKLNGFSASDLFDTPDQWQRLIQHEDTKLKLEQKIKTLADGERAEMYVELATSEDEYKTFHCELIQEKSTTDVKIIISVAQEGSVNTSEEILIDKIDIILIDNLFLPEALKEWKTGINGLIRKYYPSQRKEPSVIALTTADQKLDLEKYLNSPINNIVSKNAESKRLFFALACTGKIIFTPYTVTNLGFYETKKPVYLAKGVELSEIAEYGCALTMPRPLKPGTPLYLHDFIFDHAPDGNLCAKVIHVEPHEDKSKGFVCYLSYFGINDSFLKYTRTWIRESYAQKKEESA